MDDGIIPALNGAFPGAPIVEDTVNRTFKSLPSTGFFTVILMDIASDARGPNAAVGETDDLYRFEIVRERPMPPALGTTAGKLQRVLEAEATAIRAALQTGPTFAGIANLPYVEKVSFNNKPPVFEASLTLTVTFCCHTASTVF